jgi:hypothetical protein
LQLVFFSDAAAGACRAAGYRMAGFGAIWPFATGLVKVGNPRNGGSA